MGIFSGLFRSWDYPKDSTTGSGYALFLGGSTSGRAVTERSAMQMTDDQFHLPHNTDDAPAPVGQRLYPDHP